MRNLSNLDPCSQSFSQVAEAAAASNAVVTVAASADEFWSAIWISFSYAAAPTAGRLLVQIGGATVLDVHVTEAGANFIDFQNAPLYKEDAPKNEAMVVTLFDGGQAKKRTVRYREGAQ